MIDRIMGDGVEVTLQLASEPLYAWIDPTQLDQVLLNIAVNARQAMSDGGTLSIGLGSAILDQPIAGRTESALPGPHVVITMADNVTGIAPDLLDSIFEPFVSSRSDNTGLGLATAAGIVEQAGGHIHVASEIGKGATFSICLSQIHEHGEVARHTHRTIEQADRGHGTILLAEDHRPLRTMIERVLLDAGYKVLAVSNGRDALQCFLGNPDAIDLVLSDVTMPHISGMQLVEALRAVRSDIPALLMTGHSATAIDGTDASKLAKPFTPSELLRVVGNCLAD